MPTTHARHVVPVPTDLVWKWMSTPGAMTRLTPPFMHCTVLEEAENLRDGVARLQMLDPPLLGLTPFSSPAPVWEARHKPEEYVAGRRFVDVATSAPYAQLLDWTHTHEIVPAAGGTAVVDKVSSRLPQRVLRQFFRYRHAQLSADLSASQRYESPAQTIAVTGSSGLVGTQLTALLSLLGHRVIRLVRRDPTGPNERRWDPASPSPDLLDGVNTLIHLAGESIAGRFTDSYKDAIRDSRVEPTRRLAALAGHLDAFVCASAIGYYGADRGNEPLTETSPRGSGFLADVVAAWEDAAHQAAQAGARRVITVRTGIVLSGAGGVLGMLAPLFRLGAGGRLGEGTQHFAWIALDDVVDMYVRASVDKQLNGPINAVSPGIVTNLEFTRTLGKVLRRPTVLPVPPFGPRLLLGEEGARELALANQRVIAPPEHTFRFPQLADALRHELGRLPA